MVARRHSLLAIGAPGNSHAQGFGLDRAKPSAWAELGIVALAVLVRAPVGVELGVFGLVGGAQLPRVSAGRVRGSSRSGSDPCRGSPGTECRDPQTGDTVVTEHVTPNPPFENERLGRLGTIDGKERDDEAIVCVVGNHADGHASPETADVGPPGERIGGYCNDVEGRGNWPSWGDDDSADPISPEVPSFPSIAMVVQDASQHVRYLPRWCTASAAKWVGRESWSRRWYD